MNDAERRTANRRRVATGIDDDPISPGLTGAEVLHLLEIGGVKASGRDKSRTEFAGGWQSLDGAHLFDQRDEA